MFYDTISNASSYFHLGPRIEAALRYLQNLDPASLRPGKYEIEGREVYAVVDEYLTKPREEKRWEAHRRYIDVQFIASGREMMGCTPRSGMQSTEYNPEKDTEWLEGEDGKFLLAEPDTFVIFEPADAHMPGVSVESPEPVRKVVVKVLAG